VNSDEAGLWVTRVDGQQEEEYPLATGHTRVNIAWAWSPDGRWLAFCSAGQDGEIEHWVIEVGTWVPHPLDLPSDAHIVGWVDSPE
jgi:Tol biopolymer transport system component